MARRKTVTVVAHSDKSVTVQVTMWDVPYVHIGDDRYWGQFAQETRQGYEDCHRREDLAQFDSVYNVYDHAYNSFLTHSEQWSAYREGCRMYHDDNPGYDDPEKAWDNEEDVEGDDRDGW